MWKYFNQIKSRINFNQTKRIPLTSISPISTKGSLQNKSSYVFYELPFFDK